MWYGYITREQQVLVDGEKSRSVKVKSGVPQRTVLEPLMFLLYINGIGEKIGSLVRLFTDDSLIYPYKSQRSVGLCEDIANVTVQHQDKGCCLLIQALVLPCSTGI
jgi:hypothetical protein